jgi:hypothetical protein
MAEYTKDINDEDILYGTSEDHQYMMEWEKKYMEDCVDALEPYGDILEVGFGMGYSATQFQKHDIKSYTVLEPDPVAYARALEWAKNYKNITVLNQGWPCRDHLGKYDCFFYDPYIEEKWMTPEILQYAGCDIIHFMVTCINEHSNEKAKFSFYCSTQGAPMQGHVDRFYVMLSNMELETKFDMSFKPYEVEVPEHCNYCKTGWLYKPVITVVK